MLFFKSCPKCKGDVEFNNDMDGDYVRCLMCGFSRYLPVAPPRVGAPERRPELRKAS